jgi:hypothetical protein
MKATRIRRDTGTQEAHICSNFFFRHRSIWLKSVVTFGAGKVTTGELPLPYMFDSDLHHLQVNQHLFVASHRFVVV